MPDDDMPPHMSGKGWLQLEPLTLIPFDKHLTDWEQLAADEQAWLRRYHQRVWDTIAPMLNGEDQDWLRDACTLEN
jgi:Xaa-Pro aminopeptidase